MKPPRPPVNLTDHLEADLATAVAGYSDAIDDYEQQRAELQEQRDTLAERFKTADYKSIFEGREEFVAGTIRALQNGVAVVEQGAAVAVQVDAALADAIQDARDALVSTEEDVVASLAAQGRTAETMPNFRGNPGYAKRDFKRLVVRTAPEYIEGDRLVSALTSCRRLVQKWKEDLDIEKAAAGRALDEHIESVLPSVAT